MVTDELIIQKLDAIEIHLAASKQILTVDEAATFLNLEKSYIYQLTHAGILPYSKPNGKKLYFAREDLVQWALSNRSIGKEEREAKVATHLATNKLK